MADDSYKTIKQIAEGYYTEKRSRFISYAIPVRTVEEVKEQLDVRDKCCSLLTRLNMKQPYALPKQQLLQPKQQ